MTCQVKQKTRVLDYGIRGGLYHAAGLAAHYGTRMEAKQRAFLSWKEPSFQRKYPNFVESPLERPFSDRGIAFYFGLLISDEKIVGAFLIAILILLAVCKCFS